MTQRKDSKVTTNESPLLDTGVFVKSLPEYLVVRGLYQMAGCKIWPWHNGYKDHNDGDEKSLYVYKNVGFFKEVYPVAVGVKVLTIAELFEIVVGEQAAKAQAVPDGWALVPVEPTPEMVDASVEAWHSHHGLLDDTNKLIYRAMLEVAPEVPQ